MEHLKAHLGVRTARSAAEKSYLLKARAKETLKAALARA